MKKVIPVIIMALVSSVIVSTQDNSTDLLKAQTYAIVNITLTNSQFKDYNYILDVYDQFIKEGRVRRKEEKSKKEILTDSIYYYNPFADSDYDFVVQQQHDTLLFIKDIVTTKKIIERANIHYSYLMLSKPLFSKDFTEASIEVATVHENGGRAWQLFYKMYNNEWNLIDIRSVASFD